MGDDCLAMTNWISVEIASNNQVDRNIYELTGSYMAEVEKRTKEELGTDRLVNISTSRAL